MIPNFAAENVGEGGKRRGKETENKKVAGVAKKKWHWKMELAWAL